MDVLQQIKQTIDEAKRILVCLPKNSKPDNITAALTLKQILDKQGKAVEIISDNFLTSPDIKFLDNVSSVKPQLPALKQLVITVDTKNTPLKEFSYNVADENLEIFIEPEYGTFSPEDVSTQKNDYKFDLIITLGVASLESLGEVFRQAPDFFYTIPTINIDFKPNNERFGQINLIELSKTAVSEIIYDLLVELWGEGELDNKLATYLVTGIISETNGLKSPQLTPQLLAKVSKLITHKVDIANINKNLFHTKSLSMLKLWGRVLARLKEDKDLKLVWSLVPQEDFTKSGSSAQELPRIIDELITTYGGVDLILLLWQGTESVNGLLKTSHQHNALELMASFSPRGRADLVQFSLTTDDLAAAEEKIITSIQNKLEK
jgi:nanoRNase/pAp phosphatase (c-di-AMP/oligoRNAs hydrolase)